jgi:hypothetical protein
MEKRTSSTVLCNVNDYQTEAKRVLPKYLYEYLASGSDEEQTLEPRIAPPTVSGICSRGSYAPFVD